MRIRKKFLQLTSMTYPHGTETMLEKHLPKGYQKDIFGNYFIQIGENPTTLFTCHLDTACAEQQNVVHSFINDGIAVGTDGKTILGADDKAGMIVVLHLIEKKVEGLYYFFLGEEVGCIGSKKLAEFMYRGNLQGAINKVVSFDRRGYNSVITHQYAGRCCSDEFAIRLSQELNKEKKLAFRPDNTGVCTDSIQFQGFIPECTNISVGYFHEHTHNEVQNIAFLKILCDAAANIDWQNLPVFRNPAEEVFEEEDDDFDEDEMSFNHTGLKHFDKAFFTYMNDTENGGRRKVYVSVERVQFEIEAIYRMLSEYEEEDIKIEKINWNGDTCNLFGQEYTRPILMKINRLFGFIDNDDIRYELPKIKKQIAL